VRHEQTLVVNIGTAGALHDGLAGIHLPGTVLASGDVFVTDPAVRARLDVPVRLVKHVSDHADESNLD